ncbi:hypothetical protein HS041_08490 [Planomonospora sp. ID67723]|uniref:hypothetical protein n=1 Tax=Planomonospora sp. ID67723 TaxID=2738134 RepID=UPI0018C43A96|nr:hypothetical protein [Planomonospora sp. ID67723]MBG0827801.1 hypothetical protein [Planomonospora sp. ID67723]
MLRKIQVLLAAMACGASFGVAGIDTSAADASAACLPEVSKCWDTPPHFPLPYPPGGGRSDNDKWI